MMFGQLVFFVNGVYQVEKLLVPPCEIQQNTKNSQFFQRRDSWPNVKFSNANQTIRSWVHCKCLFQVGIARQSIAWHCMAWYTRAEQRRAEQSRAEQSRAEQSRADQTRPELPRHSTAQHSTAYHSIANELEPVFTTLHFHCNKQIGPISWRVTLQLDGKTCYVQTLQLIGLMRKYRRI